MTRSSSFRPGPTLRVACLLGSVVAGLVACEDTMEPNTPVASSIVMGEEQEGTVGESVALPHLVRVTNHRGAGGEGVAVSYRVTSGDGAFDLFGAAPDPCIATFPAREVRTDADGYAWVTFTPLAFGPVTVAVQVSDLEGQSLTFTTDASDPGASLSIVSGNNQEGETHEQLTWSFVPRLANGHGDPVSGVLVVWEESSGEGSLRGPCGDLDTSQATFTTRSESDGTTGPPEDGVFLYPRVAGIHTVSASVAGVRDSPVTFTAAVTVQKIFLDYPGFDAGFDPSDVSVPLGTPVRWKSNNEAARVVSTSAPPGGTAFDSGTLGQFELFPFIPNVAGTWEYVDEVSGAAGTLTVF